MDPAEAFVPPVEPISPLLPELPVELEVPPVEVPDPVLPLPEVLLLPEVVALAEPLSLPPVPVVPPDDGAVWLDVVCAGAVSPERATVPRRGLMVRPMAKRSDSAERSRLRDLAGRERHMSR